MNTNQPQAVLFFRARHLGSPGRDHAAEQWQIAAQRDACRRTAALLDASVIREYAEHGGTGQIERRPTLRLMLEELRVLRDADYVIVARLDRLGRMLADLQTIELELSAAGARLVIASDVLAAHSLKEVSV